MKHLLSFNESKGEDIIDICNTYLVYLKDNGFVFQLDEGPQSELSIIIHNTDYELLPFKWDEIKNDFIPFFQIFIKSFKVDSIYFYDDDEYSNNKQDIKSILNDEVIFDKDIFAISIFINN